MMQDPSWEAIGVVRGTGIHHGAQCARTGLLEPRNGEHVWMIMAGYVQSAEAMRKAQRGEQVYLDAENLAFVQSGCFVCEQPYSDRLSYRKCPGEPVE